MSEELKLVIALKGNRVSLGVQAPGCDPVLVTLEGGLAQALERVPELVEEARQRWAERPTYPKHEGPLPSQAAAPQRPVARPAPAPRPPDASGESPLRRMF